MQVVLYDALSSAVLRCKTRVLQMNSTRLVGSAKFTRSCGRCIRIILSLEATGNLVAVLAGSLVDSAVRRHGDR